MVPLRLSLRNFMCYREPPEPLVFDGLHIACLTGNNGHGKSALLDAVAWALWGESRAGSDDDLIHTGQTEMEVDLTFRIGRDAYRVIRKRARSRRTSGAGTTTLELQSIGEDGLAIPITGGTVRETQRKITDLVRMDYETFTNSAFLLQGKADLFTVKTAAQRKEVLSEILGLSLYDKLEERARTLLREAESRTVSLQRELDQLDAELRDRDEVARDLEQARSDAARLGAEQRRLDDEVAVLTERSNTFEVYEQQREELRGRIATHEAAIRVHRAEITKQDELIAKFSHVAVKREEILAGVEDLRQARAQVDAETRRQGQQLELERKVSELRRRIEEDRNSLATEIKLLTQELEQLRTRAARVSELEDALAGLAYEQDHLEKQQTELDAVGVRIADLRAQTAFLRETNKQLRTQIDEIKDSMDRIATLDDDAVCPLCQTPLGSAGRDHITSEYRRQGTDLSNQHRSNEAAAKKYDAELKQAETEAANLKNVVARGQQQLANDRAKYTKELSDARNAGDQLAQKEPKLAERQRLLDAGQYAPDDQRALASVTVQLAAINFSAEALRAAQDRQASLAHYQRQESDLQAAELGLRTAEEARTRAETLMAQSLEALAADSERFNAAEKALEGAGEVRGRLAIAQDEREKVRAQLIERQRTIGGLEQRHEELERKAALRTDKSADLDDARRDRDAFADLATAFGKRGIQALVIEQALPELEQMANDVLGRMTDGRMTVRLDSKRTTQKGTEVESLDINISDGLSTRDYDLFSGGEAFRINFALRVALSKLLARRAGAPLPTLILDEGFGSQDSAGREKLVEVLNAIQDDFECILVITHIEELKDVFPVRIEVVKTAAGSSYRMAV